MSFKILTVLLTISSWYSSVSTAPGVLVLNNEPVTSSDGSTLKKTTISNYSLPIVDKDLTKRLQETDILEINSCGVIDIEKGVFKTLPNLKQVILVANPLTNVKKGVFSDLPLEVVELRHNKIVHIEDGAFENMPNLRKLVVNGNALTEWNPNWFGKNPKLCSINFSGNLLTELGEHTFDNISCEKYQEIDFNVNKIRKIHKKTFSGLKIQRLSLVSNEIGDLEEDMFWRSDVEYLSLTGNPLTCIANKFKVQKANWFCQCEDLFTCTTLNSM